jgi:hypothetical protein
MKKNKKLPGAYVALTKDTRFEGTYEVLVPAPDRVKPHRVPLQFPTEQSAGSWIHSPEGVETIAKLLDSQRT